MVVRVSVAHTDAPSSSMTTTHNMTTHNMTTATPTTMATPGAPSPGLFGLSWPTLSDDRPSGLSHPERDASDGWGKLASGPNASRVDFLRHVAEIGLGLQHPSIDFQVPKVRFRKTLPAAQKSSFRNSRRVNFETTPVGIVL